MTKVRHARTAERGKLQFLFLPDGPIHVSDMEDEAPHFNLDIMPTPAARARGTSRISLAATGSTTLREPYNLTRQFKTLGVLHARVGWNAVTPKLRGPRGNLWQARSIQFGTRWRDPRENFTRAFDAASRRLKHSLPPVAAYPVKTRISGSFRSLPFKGGVVA
nr:LLM class flavin-dependent oxidoreductase [Rubellimicrobium rubrum]